MLPGISSIAGFIGVGSVPSVSFIDESLNTADQTTYIFTGKSTGDDTKPRIIAVAVQHVDTGTNTVSSATIFGQPATVHVNSGGSGTRSYCSIISAVIPAGVGATGTISITLSASAFRCHIGWWEITDYSSGTPEHVASATSSPLTETYTPSLDAVVIGAAGVVGSGVSFTWTNINEDFEVSGEGANERYSGASSAGLLNDETTFTGSPSSGTLGGCFVFWR